MQKSPVLAWVDAFTGTAGHGNPAVICLLKKPVKPVWMPMVAAKMNLLETAFLVPGSGGFSLR